MHVAVVGAGALGTVYGVRLATRGGVDVSFVVRRERRAPLSIQRVDGDRSAAQIDAPRRSTTMPKDADIALLCVSASDLSDALLGDLARHEGPVVTLTPLLPRDHDRLARALGERLLPGMPSVTSYRPEGEETVRYWLPSVATTLIEEPRPLLASVDALRRALRTAGIGARLERGTFEINLATTVTFLPLAFALDAAGSVDALVADEALLALAVAAAREGQALAQTVGKPAPWTEMLLKLVGPTALRLGLSFVRSRSREGVAYVEAHFARKLCAQNAMMLSEMLALARERHVDAGALRQLEDRLRERHSTRESA